MKMWSGRFRQPLDPEFEKWQRSFPYDQRLLPFELAASRAHANALKNAGVLSPEDLSEIIKGLEMVKAVTLVMLQPPTPAREPTTWMHVPSQPLMRSLLSQSLTPTSPRRARRFFRVRAPDESLHRTNHSVYFGSATFYFRQPFRPSTQPS